MTTDHVNVRVFTSAAFREMATEREALIKRVFPHLRDECSKHGVRLADIDLRWGITDEATAHNKILDIIKVELNRSAIMIAILGETFGWIPEGEYDSTLALEMYAALANPAIRLLVFQRNSAFLEQIKDKGDEIAQFNQDPVSTLEQKKLVRRLKHLGVHITPYSSIDEFVTIATRQLYDVFEETYFVKIGNVFISYSRKDIEKAERLQRLLDGLGFNVWLDLVGIAAGDEWPIKIAEAISDCDVILLLISEASLASEYCLKEIIFAKKKNKPIVGLRLDDTTLPDGIEFMLGDVQQIMLTDVSRLESITNELSIGLRRQIEKTKLVQLTTVSDTEEIHK